MTWNVESFGQSFDIELVYANKRSTILNYIKKYNPDILCLQEYESAERKGINYEIKELDSLGYKFSYISEDSSGFKKQYGYKDVKGVAIFSKLKICNTDKINISNNGVSESLIFCDFKNNNSFIRVFTAHLLSYALYADTSGSESIYSETFKRKKNIIDKIDFISSIHEKQVVKIKNVMNRSPYPLIFCGDINSVPTSYTYDILKRGLSDAFIEKGNGLGTTFYKILYSLRIDICLASKNILVKQFITPKIYVSDHFPVVADFEVN